MIAMALGLRAGPVDRRRAHHRPRRDGAGADPEAAGRAAAAPRHGDAADHPRPHHRAAYLGPGLCDAGRCHRGGGRDGARLRGTRTRLHPGVDCGRAQGPSACGGRRSRGGRHLRRPQDPLPDQGRRLAPHGGPREGGGWCHALDPGGADRRHRRRERLRQDHAGAGSAAADLKRWPHHLRGPLDPGAHLQAHAPAQAADADRLSGPLRLA